MTTRNAIGTRTASAPRMSDAITHAIIAQNANGTGNAIATRAAMQNRIPPQGVARIVWRLFGI